MAPNTSGNNTSGTSSGGSSGYPVSYIIALVLLDVFILLVNLLVIYLFITRETLRTKTNRILVGLAFTDMINGLIVIPLQITCNDVREQSFRLASMVLTRFVAASTMFHILAVTLDRHICIVHPLRYNSLVTKHRIISGICSIWMFSIFYSVIGLSWLGLGDEFNHLSQPPTLNDSKILRIEFSYTIIGFLLCFFIPLVIMSYSFTKILREISRHNKRESELILDSESHDKHARVRFDRKPVLIFMTMMLLYVVNWSSWYVQLFILSVAPQHYQPIGGTLTEYLRFATSLSNPLLYSLAKKDFRQALRKFLLSVKTNVLRLSSESRTTHQEITL